MNVRRSLELAGIAATLVVLVGCGEESPNDTALRETTSATPSATRTATATTRSTTPAPVTRSPDEEARFVATVTAETFAENEQALSTQLVKSSSLIEAQTEFRFDEPRRTVVLAVTSVFDSGSPDVAYGLASGFAPVFWGPEATAAVRPESLVLFAVTVDASSYLCDGSTMAALADRELSQEMFVQQCGA